MPTKPTSATLNALCKQFQKLAVDPAKDMTETRFSMKNGKEGWKVGTSFLREPVLMHLQDDGGCEHMDYFAGNSFAVNESIVVAVANEVQSEENPPRRSLLTGGT